MTGAEFKAALQRGEHKIGLFINSHSPTVAEQMAHSGFDWLLIDTQHGPMDRQNMGVMLAAVHAGGCKAFVRVGIDDRDGIQYAATPQFRSPVPAVPARPRFCCRPQPRPAVRCGRR